MSKGKQTPQKVFDLAKGGSADAQDKTRRIADDEEHPAHDEAVETTETMGKPTGP